MQDSHQKYVKLYENAKELIEGILRGERKSDSLREFLDSNIDRGYFRHIEDSDTEGLEIRRRQNLLIQQTLEFLDTHPMAADDSTYEHAARPVRTLIWEHSGISCDDFSKLDVRRGVRFDNAEGGGYKYFNPQNINIMTGGQKVFLTGLRGATYLDGAGKLIIYGPFTSAANNSFFTHDHIFLDPEKPHNVQGKTFSNIIIYPDCFFGENCTIFGNLNLRTFAVNRTTTRTKVIHPPYSFVGGTENYRLIEKLTERVEFPKEFPPQYLQNLTKNLEGNKNSKMFGSHLQEYLSIVKKYVDQRPATPQERQEIWSPYQEQVRKLESDLFKKLDYQNQKV